MKIDNYIQTVRNIKEEILRCRYNIAKVANKELLLLYYKVGNTISEKVAAEKWGSKTIEKLSADLQNELNGLRGFSSTNLKRMKQFYEEWRPVFMNNSAFYSISPSVTDQLENEISPSLTDQIEISRSNTTLSLAEQFVENFTSVSFTSHYEIITKVKSLDARVFYISKSAQEFWSVQNLKHQLKNKLFEKQGQLPNNFDQTIKSPQDREKLLRTFRDHYLLDFVRLSDEEDTDEKLFENEIVTNIKKFILSLGSDFAFIGNQYRIIVDDEEYYIDLLFFNRSLQALVAFELKSGKFKPEYLGKMNFYLSALDEYIKQEHEKPSIGIILCKEKKNKTVEFAFRDFNKAMGVATYTTSSNLPPQYKNILPDADTLKKLME